MSTLCANVLKFRKIINFNCFAVGPVENFVNKVAVRLNMSHIFSVKLLDMSPICRLYISINY